MPTFQQYRLALQAFQSYRLRRDYDDLAAIQQYAQVGEFFFTEMYGARDFSERDAGARRLQSFLHIVPGVMAQDVEEVLELLDLTYQLDNRMTRMLMAREVGLAFSEAIYEECYRDLNTYDERLKQLKLIVSSTYNVFRLSRYSVIGTALRGARPIARMAGIGAIHQFLLKGYEALRVVSDIKPFAETVYIRELERLNRIYEREDGVPV